MRMRTGHFGYIKDLNGIAAAGYDSAELHIREIMDFTDEEYEYALEKVQSCGIITEVFDNPLPLDKVIADPGFDTGYYTAYLQKAVTRTAKMGARYYVYGNGKTRSLPKDCDQATYDKVEGMLRTLCELAAKENITVMLEPLHSSICNVFLSIPEIYEYAQKTGIPNLKTLVDYRWFVAGGHDFGIIEQYADFIKHVHIDNPLLPFPERRVPMADDGCDYAPLFDVLKKIAYKGAISIEANTFDDFDNDIRKGLDLFGSYGISSCKTMKTGG